MPVAEVDRWLPAPRQARRDERDHLAEMRRQRKADSRQFGHFDEEQLWQRDARFLRACGRRASSSLEALAAFARLRRLSD